VIVVVVLFMILRELSAHQVSLEQRYMELTNGSVDYRAAGDARVPARS
jgi:ABC-2 type transport system ATP-binding protein